MRIVQSLWTKPLINNRWGVENQLESNIWLYALSLHYINELNCESILHTDDYGKYIFGFLPYNEIHLTLNKIKDNNPIFWAQGKMYVYKEEKIGSIHVDGDIFLKNKDKILPLLEYNNYDLIAQNYEDGNSKIYKSLYEMISKLIDDKSRTELFNNNNLSINTGILGFNNIELKNKYINGYFNFRDKISQNINFIDFSKDKMFSPDMVIEQLWLQTICNENKCNLKLILPPLFDKEINKKANDIGFTHLLGSSKYNTNIINKVKNRLLEQNEELYNIVDFNIKSKFNK